MYLVDAPQVKIDKSTAEKRKSSAICEHKSNNLLFTANGA